MELEIREPLLGDRQSLTSKHDNAAGQPKGEEVHGACRQSEAIHRQHTEVVAKI